ncbi:hypothetical protein GQX74_002588 [Glossina fuscipes]|nr:hypothetical protein GQX74_002588 [Glossina fuscipes]
MFLQGSLEYLPNAIVAEVEELAKLITPVNSNEIHFFETFFVYNVMMGITVMLFIFIINYNSNYQVFKKLIKLKSANASSQLALNVAICNQGLNQTCGYNRHCDNDQFLTKFKYTVISKHQYVPPQRPLLNEHVSQSSSSCRTVRPERDP